jgi:two-component system OmpR family response regulator
MMPNLPSSLRVLVIEDDAASRQAIAEALRESRHTVFEAADGPAGLAIALKERLDAVVLDLKLPRMDGIQLLSKLREAKDVPVIVVSARRTTDDRVEALELGADDYLTKPFAIRELLARLRAVVRRSSPDTAAEMTIGDVVIDFDAMAVSRGGERIPLTAMEFGILAHLARRRGEVVPREVLETSIRQEGSAHVSNVVDVIILRLRRKLGRDLITTRRGQGFLIEWQDGRG